MTNLHLADALLEAAKKKIDEADPTTNPDDKTDSTGNEDSEESKDKDKTKKVEKIVLNPELQSHGRNSGGTHAPDMTGTTRLQTV